MDEQMNNMGGQAMGIEKSVSSPIRSDQMPPSYMAASAPLQPADLYSQPMPLPVQPPVPNGTSQQATTLNQNNNAVMHTTVPSVADDSDLIEKEWVEKAKTIVEKTRRDPFLQSQELNSFKMEYLQKRYGKNVGSDGS